MTPAICSHDFQGDGAGTVWCLRCHLVGWVVGPGSVQFIWPGDQVLCVARSGDEALVRGAPYTVESIAYQGTAQPHLKLQGLARTWPAHHFRPGSTR